MHKVILSHRVLDEGMRLFEGRADVYVANSADPEAYYDQLEEAEAVILRLAKFDRAAFEHAPNLRVIGRTGVGYDSVDIEAANEYGVPVVITPGANSRSVAEHAVALAFALSKNIVAGHNEMLNGHFSSVRNQGKVFELAGKTVGFVGYGAIGRIAAKIFSDIGMQIMVYDPYVKQETIEELGYRYVKTLDALLPEADVVTVHVPLTSETAGMIGREELTSMKSSAVLINCARGGIVDETALTWALNHDIIAGAGLDVTEHEPPRAEDPILTAKNLILSPHIAAQTREASFHMAKMCIESCFDVLDGKKVSNVANPEAYSHPRWN